MGEEESSSDDENWQQKPKVKTEESKMEDVTPDSQSKFKKVDMSDDEDDQMTSKDNKPKEKIIQSKIEGPKLDKERKNILLKEEKEENERKAAEIRERREKRFAEEKEKREKRHA